MQYYLGIDWGEKKCGTALADEETRLAFVWKIFSSTNFEKELAENSSGLLFKGIVLGISAHYHFSKENQKKVLAFKKRLEKNGQKVFLQEEFFTTRLAQNNLREKRANPRRQKVDDQEAARLILQSWLDKTAR